MGNETGINNGGSVANGLSRQLREAQIANARLTAMAQDPTAPILDDESAIKFYKQKHEKGEQAKKVKSGVKPL